MSDRRKEIPAIFFRGDEKPIAETVEELIDHLKKLPGDLPVMSQEGGAALIVYNAKTDPFLAIEEGDDWEAEDERR